MTNHREQMLTLHACAKVNLCLSIGYPPHDGYHRLRSVFQEVDLCDVLHFSVIEGVSNAAVQTAAGTHVDLRCDVAGLSTADNLVFRALDQAELTFGRPVVAPDNTLVIEIEKRIPAGGGLGGGSSDAAAMLKTYAHLMGIDAHEPLLVDVARKLGADVAFFLHGGTALMGGCGDVFERSLPPLEAPIVLMGSNAGNSTAEVYRVFDDDPQPELDADALADALEQAPQDPAQVAALCGNNLGPAACELDPFIQKRIDAALSFPGVLSAFVSGSGATSFAICESKAVAKRFAESIAPLCGWVEVCSV